MRAIRPHAEAHRLDEILLAPATDPGARMRRDVRAEERTERGRERAPAGIGLRARPRLGVAADAAGGLRNIEAALPLPRDRLACDGDHHHRAAPTPTSDA